MSKRERRNRCSDKFCGLTFGGVEMVGALVTSGCHMFFWTASTYNMKLHDKGSSRDDVSLHYITFH